MTMKTSVILLVVAATVSGFPSVLQEGDTCRTSEGKGVCQRIKNCPQAVQAVMMGNIPEKCGFFRKEIIVCCIKIPRVSQRQCENFRSVYNPKLGRKVLQGKNITEAELPHMAAIGGFLKGQDDEFNLLCSGTLISEQFVMTAAHCFMDMDFDMFKRIVVYLGISISDVENNVDGLFDIDRKNIFQHPLYKMYYHDIALLKLSAKIYSTDTMVPACLYTMGHDPEGPLMVAGWGATNKLGTKLSPNVLVANITSVSAAECEEPYRVMYSRGINGSLICAGDPEGNIDTCKGDSGGPLLAMEKSGYYTVFGITSYGRMPCGTPYTIYTRVSAYIDWIEFVVWSSG